MWISLWGGQDCLVINGRENRWIRPLSTLLLPLAVSKDKAVHSVAIASCKGLSRERVLEGDAVGCPTQLWFLRSNRLSQKWGVGLNVHHDCERQSVWVFRRTASKAVKEELHCPEKAPFCNAVENLSRETMGISIPLSLPPHQRLGWGAFTFGGLCLCVEEKSQWKTEQPPTSSS